MNLFNKMISIAFAAFLFAGCASEIPQISDEPAYDTAGALSIVPGNTFETVREPGTLQGVLMSVRIRNTTAHPIEFSLPTTTFHGRIGTPLNSTFRFVTYRDHRGTALGACDGELNSGSVDSVAYGDVVRLDPGDVMELVLHANVLADADNSVEIGMGDGGLLLVDARFADTGDFVPAEFIRGNAAITRLVRVELP